MAPGLKRVPFYRQDTSNDDSLASIGPFDDNLRRGSYGDSKRGGASSSVTSRLSGFDVDEGLIHFEQNHRWDPNLPLDYVDQIHEALKANGIEAEIAVERSLAEQSPYPEAQSAVRNYDEDIPCGTIRAWAIGLLLTTVGSALNMIFSMRYPSITITSIVAQLIAYPLGLGWHKVVPSRTFSTFGYKWSLNPGKFNMKEHTMIVVMTNASFGGGAAYSTDVLLAQQKFYGQDFGWVYKLLLT
jgi:hypothetical protein